MFPAIIAGKVFKLLLPKVLDHAMEVFKLDKILEYVEEDNELDHKVKDLEDEIKILRITCQDLAEKVKKG